MSLQAAVGGVNYHDLPLGKGAPNIVNCVVEISKDSNAKYEYDDELNVFRLDRCLMSSMLYPASYGFIPSTVADDGDALDIMIWNSTPLITGSVVSCRIIGVLDMEDGGHKDYKLLGVPTYNPHNYDNISDIEPMFLEICKQFFRHYKELEHKVVKIGEWQSKEMAMQYIAESHNNYISLKNQLAQS
jgi:inorganic pyrophosphatase